MGILDKLKKKNEVIEKNESQIIKQGEYEEEKYSLVEMNNYMLTDVRKEIISKNCYSLSLTKLSKISPLAVLTANNIKTIVEKNQSHQVIYIVLLILVKMIP